MEKCEKCRKKAVGYTQASKIKRWWCLSCYETTGKYPDNYTRRHKRQLHLL